MKNRSCVASLLLLVFSSCATDRSPDDASLGIEVQGYPAGIIPGLHWSWPLSERSELTLRAGYNFSDRQDFGEHDDEDGGGPGGGVGYRRFFGNSREGWLIGARVDVWDLEIDWREDIGTSGTTDVVVVQPTAELGYGWRLGPDGTWRLEATLGLGAEINVDTDGEDVGEGAILLIGFTLLPSW